MILDAIPHMDYTQLRRKYDDLLLSPKQVLQQALRLAGELSHLNIFVEIFEEEALCQAQESEERFIDAKARPLEGMLVAVKDNILYHGHLCTAASEMLEGFVAPYSATVVNRLRENGAIIVGRSNCDEFAMGSTGGHSIYGACLNPNDPQYLSGGSSSGSAAAVAAGIVQCSLGSDTGGSVRLPASWCGVYGLKPQYGRISRHGLIAYASSLDHIGLLGKSNDDLELLLTKLSGFDQEDYSIPSSLRTPYLKEEKEEREEVKEYSFYTIKELDECLEKDSCISKRYHKLIADLKGSGVKVEELSFPEITDQVKANQMISCSEATSNMGRYDGIRFGKSLMTEDDPISLITQNRSRYFGKEVKRKIIFGSYALHASRKANYIQKATLFRHKLCEFVEAHLGANRFFISPTSSDIACLQTHELTFQEQYEIDLFTVLANLCGIPAISLPFGANDDGLPFGLQLCASTNNESGLFGASRMITLFLDPTQIK